MNKQWNINSTLNNINRFIDAYFEQDGEFIADHDLADYGH